MMKKTLTICLGLALILTLCGTFAGALASEVENGIDAIEDACNDERQYEYFQFLRWNGRPARRYFCRYRSYPG